MEPAESQPVFQGIVKAEMGAGFGNGRAQAVEWVSGLEFLLSHDN